MTSWWSAAATPACRIIGTDVKEPLRQVSRLGRVVGADGRDLALDGGARHRTDAVVRATGFRPHYPWLEAPVLDETGAPRHEGGVTS